MPVILRDYQEDGRDEIYEAWAEGHKNVLAVFPTGAGKTILFTQLVKDYDGYAIAIAHRKELVEQISLALCMHGVTHNIIAPMSTIKQICKAQAQEHGKIFYSANSKKYVAGIDTLLNKDMDWEKFGLWVTDEAHHLLEDNKWGRGISKLVNARGLGVTATPERADRRA